MSYLDPFMFMSNGIGVGAITLTKDHFVVLVKRAGWTGEGAHKIDRPGGHPEPDLVWKVSLSMYFLMNNSFLQLILMEPRLILFTYCLRWVLMFMSSLPCQRSKLLLYKTRKSDVKKREH